MAIEITSKDNQAVKAAAKLMSSARERRQTGRFIAEGIRLCTEVLENHCKICEVFYTEDAYLRYTETVERLERAAGKSYQITDEIAEKIADTVTPQGVFVVAEMIVNTIDLDNIKTDGQFVLLENLQDPGNVGAIFRTAEALGLNGAFLTNDSCDPYNPKTIRASMGAVFRLPYLIVDDVVTAMKECKAKNMRPIASVPDEASKITAIRFFKGAIMCIGNEGNGLSEQLKAVCGEKVTIPMNGRAESLNAATAAAILMWEMVRHYA
ncbi:MAG: RNA methyltransferase [Ruminococcaceae bacterium]|nr:RNA methyltransferase [Oscillospiraceae bacterium]